MTYRGRVKNGVVVPEVGALLPEGADVTIDVTTQPRSTECATDENKRAVRPMYDRYKNVIGVVKNMPSDASERVDDILYGPAEP